MFKFICTAVMFAFATTAMAQTATNPGMPAGISDGEIAKILMTINEGEIDTNKVGEDRVKNPELKQFAKMMVNDHKANSDATKALTKKLKSDAKESDMSKSLKEELKNAKNDLKKADKKAFDKAYITQQVTLHQKALDTINGTLIPSAKDAELKAHLEKTRDAVQAHLDHAKNLDTKIQ